MSASQQDPPGQPDPTRPADIWGSDELDRLLADPLDAGPVGRILAAASAPAGAGLLPGEEAARSAYRAAFAVSAVRKPRVRALVSGRAAAFALAGGLVLSGGAAAAATGSLPDPVQQRAKGALAKLGVSVPGPDKRHVGHPGRRVTTTQGPTPTAAPRDREQPGTGNEVSEAARGTASTGVDKGATVSGLASDGKSQAGQHGKATNPSTGKVKNKTPKPQATKHGNGRSHKPNKGSDGHTPKPKHTPSPHGIGRTIRH